MLRRRGGVAAVLLTALGYGAWLHARALPRWRTTTPHATVGAFHVHSSDSHDSIVPPEAIADAARDASLDFVVLTDHNHQRPRPTLTRGVCLLSHAELSTATGHAVQLGASYVPDATVRASDRVATAVVAAGGALVLAHPSDPKRPWTGTVAGVGGIEVANLAASARRVGGRWLLGLLPLLASWPLNRPLALAQLYGRDDEALARWDAAPTAPWMGICGSDAHGWIDVGLNVSSWHVVLNEPWPTDDRAGALLAALRGGRFSCAAGLLGRAPHFRFVARGTDPPGAGLAASGGAPPGAGPVAQPGDCVAAAAVAALEVEASATDAGDSTIVLRRDGVAVQVARAATLSYPRPPPGAYRAEVYVPIPRLGPGRRWLPAIYSNRIRLQPARP